MNIQRRLGLLILAFYWNAAPLGFWQDSAALSAQEVEQATRRIQKPSTLLSDWHGRWQGEVSTVDGTGKSTPFQMELNIQPTENPEILEWSIIYDGTAGRSVRPYQLHVVNAKRGQYVIDEQNGIRLSATLLGDAVCFHFSTGGSRIWGTYGLDSAAKQIKFELFVGSEDEESDTGGGTVPIVRTLPPQSRQTAILHRVSGEATRESNGLTDGKGQ